ncbi:MAG: mannose-1-phosphate guanylyltransferase/mannose-6-phosphate isomerase [Candidatus Omnitrophica bacterium]|nr:mannose-1-phosphate guanylyltransferase/mannose-6-phosphate isomerase [Candidatus Omnitrophota bacterium]
MANHNFAVLLAGGQGSRFWPQSRTLEPKQFLSLHQDKSLFEQTIIRISRLIPPQNIFIATSELYRSQIAELVKPHRIPEQNIIYEPDGRNTAPSIGVCAMLIHRRDPYGRIAVLPCDHLIKNKARFLQIVRKAFSLCDDTLVILGIPPARPATGYGYIERGKGMSVKRFTEKPDLATAKRFVASGRYYWNGGIFVGSSKAFLNAYKKCLPAIYAILPRMQTSGDIVKVWKKMPAISFDYGILEKTKDLAMIAATGLGWSDLGSWQAWDEILPKDKAGNVMKADVVNIGSQNITVVGSDRLIATIGLDDLVIVDTPDALLITKKDRTEDVKKVVDDLKARRRQEHYVHKTAKRPWGSYTVLDMGDGFKVKQVEVKPGCALSLQYHKKRSEHWVVVEGTAKIVRGRKSFLFDANESTYIPVGCKHRLCNPSKDQVLKIIEVQAGKYLEEDDIVRLKDDFGRK